MATISLIIPDALLSTYLRLQVENGVSFAADTLVKMLQDFKPLFEKQDTVAFKAKFDTLPSEDQDAILAILAKAKP